jgi:hypothetical protein
MNEARRLEVRAMRRHGSAPIRIDWFGNVTKSTRSGIFTPYLTLACTAVMRDPDGAVVETSPRGSLSIDVPIHWMRLLRLGDIWENGTHVGTEPLEHVAFTRLTVDQLTAAIAPCGRSTEGPGRERRHDLPFAAFDRHAPHTQAFMVRVQVQPNVALLVPSMELVRFYFGTSGALLGNIFSGAFAKHRLYTYAYRNPHSGVARLTLAPGIHGIAASTVARIAFDVIARRQFNSIVNTGVSASVSGRPWYPRMGFPFEGETDLTCEGVWLDLGDERTFVVSRLLSCSHPFPFSKLFYEAPAPSTAPLQSAPGSRPADGGPKPGAPEVVIRQAAQDNKLAPAVVAPARAESEAVPFPDLVNKQIARIRESGSRGGRAASLAAKDGEGPIELAHGLGRSGSSRPLEVVESGVPVSTGLRVPKSLADLLSELRKMGDASVDVQARWPTASAPVRFEVDAPEGQRLGVWQSMLVFPAPGDYERQIRLLAAEDSVRAGSPDLVAFDDSGVSEEGLRQQALRASIFWAQGAEKEAVEDEFFLVHSWEQQRLLTEGVSGALLELLRHVATTEVGWLDQAVGSEPEVLPGHAPANLPNLSYQATKFLALFERVEKTLDRRARREMSLSLRQQDGQRREPDWWGLARRAAGLLTVDPPEELQGVVERLCGAAKALNRLDQVEVDALRETADPAIARAFFGIRSLRNFEMHLASGGEDWGDSVGDDILRDAEALMNAYLDRDFEFLADFQAASD